MSDNSETNCHKLNLKFEPDSSNRRKKITYPTKQVAYFGNAVWLVAVHLVKASVWTLMFNLHSSQASIRIRQSSPAVAEGTNDHSVPVAPNSVSRVAVLFLHRFIFSVNGHKFQKLNS